MKKWINILVLSGLIGAWFALFAIQFLDHEKIKNHESGIFKLHGAFEKKKDTTLTASNWFNRIYQQRKTAYLNEEFFPRAVFVKASNQYNYSLFSEISAKEIYECKEGYFFRYYMDDFKPSYNFKGDKHIDSITNDIIRLQQLLDSNNTKLLCVIAPDKGRIYPEYLTDNFKEDESRNPNNYQAYLKCFETKRINYIDFNDWYAQIKDTFQIPIFSKNGVHWTQSASSFAIDSIQNYMEHTSGDKYPDLVLKNKHYKLLPWKPDVDASETMNLLWPPDEIRIPYFNVSVNDSTLNKPKVLVISDSFWDAPSWSGYDKLLFQNQEYWYYNRTFRNYIDPERPISNKDYERLLEYDYIVVLATEMNLSDFGWGFFNKSLEVLQNEK